MDPATIALIMAGLQAAIAAAPQVAELAIKAKELIATLFTNNLISRDQQNAMAAHVDAVCNALIAGEVAPEWTVEPDPV